MTRAKTGENASYRVNGWCGRDETRIRLVYWIASGVPRRLILEYCEESGVKVPGSLLGERLQRISTFAKTHRDEIEMARAEFRVSARTDAQERRERFMDELYSTKDTLNEHMMTDRDKGGRLHLVREYTNICNLIADFEGFKKGAPDPHRSKAMDALVERMFARVEDGAQEPVIDAKVTVLEPAQLPPGQERGY